MFCVPGPACPEINKLAPCVPPPPQTQGASLLISGQAGPGTQNIQSSEEFSAVSTVAVD
jgi:hypothetical protein